MLGSEALCSLACLEQQLLAVPEWGKKLGC